MSRGQPLPVSRTGTAGALVLLAVLLALLLDIARSATPTVDEFADVPAGLAILRAGDFRLDLRNPPLMKALVALPAWAMGARLPPASYRQEPTGWWPWVHGSRFLEENRDRYLSCFVAARALVAVLAVLLGWLVFDWARELHGPGGGLVSLACFVFCPTVLAHASLATLDLGATLLFFAGARALDVHLRRRSRPALAIAGLASGAALAAKFSTVVLFPALALGLVLEGGGSLAGRVRGGAWRLLAIAGLALVALELAYGLPPPVRLGDLALRSPPGALARAVAGRVPLPLPAEFVLGFDDALAYARDPEIPGYLDGEWSKTGWWYYHLEAFALKEPLPLLLLLALALVPARRRGAAATGDRRRARLPVLLWLPPALLLLSLVSWNRVQYGLRYALPAYPFLLVAAGRLAPRAAGAGQRRLLVASIALTALATLSVHPHELAYFNWLGGGPEKGWRHLADSNLDWGQDLGRLAATLRSRYPGRTVRLAYFGHVDPAFYGIPYEVLAGREDARGLIAVSASYLAGEPYAITWKGPVPEPVPAFAHAWLAGERPVGRVGYSIYLYEVPERGRIDSSAVFLLALGLRLGYLHQLAATPYRDALVVDEEMYDERGRAVAAGDLGLGARPYYQDPLYPYALGLLYRFAGHDLALVRQVQAVLGAASAALVAGVALVAGGPLAGIVAGLLAATCRPLLFYEGQIEKTSLTVAVATAALAATRHAARRRTRLAPWALAGAAWGLLALLRGNALVLLPFAAAYAGWASRRLRCCLVLGLAGAAVILPATARNRRVAGEWVLVTSQGGQNFYIGNWEGNRTGLYVPPPFLRPHPRHEEADFARAAEAASGRRLTAREVSAFWWRQGLAAVRRDPAGFARRSLLRLGWSIHPDDVPDNYDLAFLARFVPLLRAPLADARLLVALGLVGLFTAARAGAGATAGAEPGATARLLAGFVVLYLASLSSFFVFGRYRTPLFPPLAVGAGLLAASTLARFRSRRWLSGTGGLAAAGAVFLALPALPPVSHHPGQDWNTLGAIYEKEGDRQRAAEAFAQANAIDPDNPLAASNQARMLCDRGRRDEALALYRQAIALAPLYAEAHANLGACLLDADRPDEAEGALARALALDPELAEAAFNLADAHERLGRRPEAIRGFLDAARLAGTGSRLEEEARRRAARLADGGS